MYAAPLIAAAGASVTTSIMASSAATFAVANAEAVAWGTVGLVGGGIAVKSDIENKEYGQIPMDLATAVLGGLMLKGTASSYRSTVGVKPNVGVNGGSRLKPNYQQFADDAGVSKTGANISTGSKVTFEEALKKLDKSGLRPGQTEISRSRVMQIVENYDPIKASSSVYTDATGRYLVEGHHTTVANTILGRGSSANMNMVTPQVPSITNVYWTKKWYEFWKTSIKVRP